ncbi:MAG TPA: hypothetical protein VFE41_19460, partial [Acetobacteraceae bacterium]|nr:hypothetical protein [Acetobacteraceae bacterium]
WWREPDQAWQHVRLEGLDAEIVIPDLDVTHGLRTLYAGLTFRPRPRPRPRLWCDDGGPDDQVG